MLTDREKAVRRLYYQTHSEERKRIDAEYYKKNREIIRKKNRIRYKKDRKKRLDYYKNYAKKISKDPVLLEVRRLKQRIRYAKIKNTPKYKRKVKSYRKGYWAKLKRDPERMKKKNNYLKLFRQKPEQQRKQKRHQKKYRDKIRNNPRLLKKRREYHKLYLRMYRAKKEFNDYKNKGGTQQR